MVNKLVFGIAYLVGLHAACTQVLSADLQPPKKLSWEQLNREITKSPNNAVLWVMRGEVLAKSFEDTEAIESFARAIKLDPKLSTAYLDRGDAYMTYQKTGEALADYVTAQKLLKVTPNVWEISRVQRALAECHKIRKEYDLELPIRQTIARNSPRSQDLTDLANCYLQNKLSKEAGEAFSLAIKKAPTSVDAHRQLAEFCLNNGNNKQALEEFTRAIDIVTAKGIIDISGNHALYERRAVCYDKLGHHELAVGDRRRSQNWQESIFDATPVRDSRNEK